MCLIMRDAQVRYVNCSDLLDNEKIAQKVVLESKLFCVIEGVLYREDPLFPGVLLFPLHFDLPSWKKRTKVILLDTSL